MKISKSIFAPSDLRHQELRGGSKKSIQQGRSHFCARSVPALREHGKMARTRLVAFFNGPIMFVTLCAALSFGFSYLFPQGDQWLTDWQVSQKTARPVSSSIAIVEAGKQSSALCGDGQWNLNVLASLILALHQADVAVIGPMLDVSLPVASQCGGLQGFVQLAEVTKHVGSVVYSDSVPSALTQAAVQTGFLRLYESSKNGGFTISAGSLLSPSLPFGIAVASLLKDNHQPQKADSFLHIPDSVINHEEGAYHSYQFEDIWELVQSGKQEELRRLFRGKAVFLSVDLSMRSQSSLSHVALANAYMTNSWVRPAPFILAFLISLGLGCLGMVLIWRELSLRHMGSIIGVMIFLVSVVFILGYQWNWTWPMMSMGMTVGLTLSGMGAWKLFQTRSTVQQDIANREQLLAELKDDVLLKQQDVRLLEAQLSETQRQSVQAGSVIEVLQHKHNTSLAQLVTSQSEIQETYRKIKSLQGELFELRQQLPVISEECPQEACTNNALELSQECEAFQIVTRDPVVLALFQNLKKAAATQVPILLLGETGTGKEVFAKAAHAMSPRRQGPFISVNMAAICAELFEGELFGHVKGAFTGAVGRKGFLESAHGGTIFLDEVGDLPLDLQAKLLRFLEDGGFHRVGQSTVTHVDVRIIAATNRDLPDEVREGRYREDLYYRLRSIVLTLPPLRARSQADHVLLAQSFLEQCAQSQHRTDLAFTQGALDAITAYQWPGNIRELRLTVAQAVALTNGSVITAAELNLENPSSSVVDGNWANENMGQQEDTMVLECLRQHKFEMQATAATLGWDRSTVTQRLKGLGFQALVKCQGDIHAAAVVLAGDERFVPVLERRLREYSKNLVSAAKNYRSVEEAITDCRKRFRNLPERHFPAVEHLLHRRFTAS